MDLDNTKNSTKSIIIKTSKSDSISTNIIEGNDYNKEKDMKRTTVTYLQDHLMKYYKFSALFFLID